MQQVKAEIARAEEPKMRQELEEIVIPKIKSQSEMLQKQEQQAQAEEAEADQQLRDEQVKLAGINDLLDRYNTALEEVGR